MKELSIPVKAVGAGYAAIKSLNQLNIPVGLINLAESIKPVLDSYYKALHSISKIKSTHE